MSCEVCTEFNRWIERMARPEPLTTEERLALREFLRGQQESHIDAAGEASWEGG